MSNEPEYVDLTTITNEQLKQLHDNFINCGKAFSKPVSNFVTNEVEKFNLNDLNDIMILQNLVQNIKDLSHQLDGIYNAIMKVAVFKKLEVINKDKIFYN